MTIWLWEPYRYILRNEVRVNKIFRKRKRFFIISAFLIAIFLFLSVALAVEIEIRPVLEGEAYYTMELGEIQTFEASGFSWNEDREEKIPGIEIKEIQWNFDSRFLELVEKKNAAITLRAIRKRTSKLTATGKIANELVTKTIFIVIERENK